MVTPGSQSGSVQRRFCQPDIKNRMRGIFSLSASAFSAFAPADFSQPLSFPLHQPVNQLLISPVWNAYRFFVAHILKSEQPPIWYWTLCYSPGLLFRAFFWGEDRMSTFEKLAVLICFAAIAAALMFYKLHHLWCWWSANYIHVRSQECTQAQNKKIRSQILAGFHGQKHINQTWRYSSWKWFR